jgi:hypothetical protein
MYRDTFRGVCLCALGRAALDLGDAATSRVAFRQAEAHLRGRPRTLGGGHLMVQALAGLARAEEGAARNAALDEALALWRTRDGHDFSLMWACTPPETRRELSLAAETLGRAEQASAIRAEGG